MKNTVYKSKLIHIEVASLSVSASFDQIILNLLNWPVSLV